MHILGVNKLSFVLIMSTYIVYEETERLYLSNQPKNYALNELFMF